MAIDLRKALDDALSGGLDDLVRAERWAGRSWRHIRRLLYERTGVDVSHETLRAWYAGDVETERGNREALLVRRRLAGRVERARELVASDPAQVALAADEVSWRALDEVCREIAEWHRRATRQRRRVVRQQAAA